MNEEKKIKNSRVIKAIMKLMNKDGLILPEAVVEAARPTSSPLHKYFEWNNSKAAHEHRLEQARYLLRVVYVPVIVNNQKKDCRAFRSLVSVRYNGKGGGYRPVEVIMSTREYREELLQNALDELMRIRNRYAELRELASLFEAIDRTIARRRKK